MGATDIIFELRRKGYSVRADGNYLDISPAENIPLELVSQLKQSKLELLAELQRETRRAKVLSILQADPSLNRAYSVDSNLAIPRAKYDP